MNRRTFITNTAVVAAGSSLILTGFDIHDVEVTQVRFQLGLNQPLRLVALGDIHYDSPGEETYMLGVVRMVNDLRPDLIVYTGDFITNEQGCIPGIASILSGCAARLGSYATLGNHDHWSAPGLITSNLERRGIRVLLNQSVALPGEEQVFLSALDSFWAGNPDVGALAKTPVHSRHILLVHEPDPFTQLTDPRIKLQISGHTHGGQVRFPIVGPVHLPKWGRRFDIGLFTRDGRTLYVNRGIGTLAPHVRFQCRPEITVFELT